MKKVIELRLMKKMVFVFLLFAVNEIKGQDYRWAHGFGGPNFDAQGNSIDIDAQANIYVTGVFSDSIDFDPGGGTDTLPANSSKMFLAKYDSAGAYIWALTTESTGTSIGKHISVNSAGVCITGIFNGTVDFDPGTGVSALTSAITNNAFVARYSLTGNLVWVFKLDGSVNGIESDINGSFYLTGVFGNTIDFDPSPQAYNLTTIGGSDIFTAKYDSSGNLVWAKNFGGNFNDAGLLLLLINNEIIVHGVISDTADMDPGTNVATLVALFPPPNGSYFLAKYDTSGNYLIAFIAPQAGFGELSNTASSNASFYVIGTFGGTADFDLGAGTYNLISAGQQDVCFAKYDINLGLIWAKNFGAVNFTDVGWGLKETGNGNIFLTGFFGNTADFDPGSNIANLTSAGDKDIFLAQYDTAGNYIWAGRMGGSQEDAALSLTLDANGNQYLTGLFENIADFDPTASTVNLTGLPLIHSIFIAKYEAIPNGIFNAEEQDALTLTLYPNPASDFIFCKEILSESLLEITDVIGKTIYCEIYHSNKKINVSSFPPGAYIVSVTQNQETYRAKFIKK